MLENSRLVDLAKQQWAKLSFNIGRAEDTGPVSRGEYSEFEVNSAEIGLRNLGLHERDCILTREEVARLIPVSRDINLLINGACKRFLDKYNGGYFRQKPTGSSRYVPKIVSESIAVLARASSPEITSEHIKAIENFLESGHPNDVVVVFNNGLKYLLEYYGGQITPEQIAQGAELCRRVVERTNPARNGQLGIMEDLEPKIVALPDILGVSNCSMENLEFLARELDSRDPEDEDPMRYLITASPVEGVGKLTEEDLRGIIDHGMVDLSEGYNGRIEHKWRYDQSPSTLEEYRETGYGSQLTESVVGFPNRIQQEIKRSLSPHEIEYIFDKGVMPILNGQTEGHSLTVDGMNQCLDDVVKMIARYRADYPRASESVYRASEMIGRLAQACKGSLTPEVLSAIREESETLKVMPIEYFIDSVLVGHAEAIGRPLNLDDVRQLTETVQKQGDCVRGVTDRGWVPKGLDAVRGLYGEAITVEHTGVLFGAIRPGEKAQTSYLFALGVKAVAGRIRRESPELSSYATPEELKEITEILWQISDLQDDPSGLHNNYIHQFGGVQKSLNAAGQELTIADLRSIYEILVHGQVEENPKKREYSASVESVGYLLKGRPFPDGFFQSLERLCKATSPGKVGTLLYAVSKFAALIPSERVNAIIDRLAEFSEAIDSGKSSTVIGEGLGPLLEKRGADITLEELESFLVPLERIAAAVSGEGQRLEQILSQFVRAVGEDKLEVGSYERLADLLESEDPFDGCRIEFLIKANGFTGSDSLFYYGRTARAFFRDSTDKEISTAFSAEVRNPSDPSVRPEYLNRETLDVVVEIFAKAKEDGPRVLRNGLRHYIHHNRENLTVEGIREFGEGVIGIVERCKELSPELDKLASSYLRLLVQGGPTMDRIEKIMTLLSAQDPFSSKLRRFIESGAHKREFFEVAAQYFNDEGLPYSVKQLGIRKWKSFDRDCMVALVNGVDKIRGAGLKGEDRLLEMLLPDAFESIGKKVTPEFITQFCNGAVEAASLSESPDDTWQACLYFERELLGTGRTVQLGDLQYFRRYLEQKQSKRLAAAAQR